MEAPPQSTKRGRRGRDLSHMQVFCVCERARKNCENDFLACARAGSGYIYIYMGSCGRVIKSLYSRSAVLADEGIYIYVERFGG